MQELGTGAPSSEERRSVGSLIGALIIIAVLIVGTLHLWGAWLEKHRPVLPESASDELEVIESDLEVTGFDDLEGELRELEEIGEEF